MRVLEFKSNIIIILHRIAIEGANFTFTSSQKLGRKRKAKAIYRLSYKL